MKKNTACAAFYFLIFLISSAKSQTQIPANVANFHDPRALFTNPAALGVRENGLFVSGYQRPHLSLAGESFGTFYSGVGFNLSKAGAIGVNARWFQAPLFNTLRGGLSYAFPFKIGGKKIAFGVSAGMLSTSYDAEKFDLREQNDPLLSGGASKSSIDFGAGVTANVFKEFYFGLSVDHLNKPDISLAGGLAALENRFSFGAIYMHRALRPQFSLEREEGQTYFNFGLESWLLNERAMLRGYLQSEKMILGAAYRLQNWRLDFEYDYPTTSANEITNGSLHLTLSYDFRRKRKPDFADDFELMITPSREALKGVIPGKNLQFKVTLAPGKALSNPVRLAIESTPDNISAQVFPARLTPGDSATVHVETTKSSVPNLYNLPLTGETPSAKRQAAVPVRVRRAELAAQISAQPDRLVITELKTISEERPLLNFVFFKENSAAIPPERYILLENTADDLPQIETFTRVPSIAGQYGHSLNFFGRRMTDNPAYQIILVGCNTNVDAEQGNLTLSRARAESVKKYLVEVWGISANRIAVQARNLPETPSPTSDPRGREENRRVEIVPRRGSGDILAAFNSTIAETEFSTPNAVFLTEGMTAEAGINNWRLTLARSNQYILREFTGNGAPPAEIPWRWQDRQGAKINFQDSVKYVLSVTDSLDQQAHVSGPPIDVRYVRRDTISEPEIQRSRLLFFAFDDFRVNLQSPHLRKELEKIEVRFRETPQARIEVKGFTDTLGELGYNVGLSQRRAQAVKEELVRRGIPADRISSAGFGPDSPIMSNALPEGRMMNRRVEVDVISER